MTCKRRKTTGTPSKIKFSTSNNKMKARATEKILSQTGALTKRIPSSLRAAAQGPVLAKKKASAMRKTKNKTRKKKIRKE